MALSPYTRVARRLPAALVAAVVLLVAGLAAVASAAPPPGSQIGAIFRLGQPPRVPGGARAQGVLPRSSVISAMVALTPRDPTALAHYADAVSTPGSPEYHRYLSVAQFAERFGPTAAQVDAVRAALEASGLRPGVLAPNRLTFNVTASAGTMSRAFATSFARYRLPGNRTAFANTAAPALPASVAGLVEGVVGLDSLQVPHPAGLAKRRPGRPSSHAAARSASAPGEGPACSSASATGGYTAGEIAGAYGLSDLYAAGDGGSGTTVALFELEPYSASDVAAYQACYGTATSVTNIAVGRGSGTGAGSGEAALDIEDVIGLAPNASILVYEGENSGTGALQTYQAIVTQNRAQVVSTSWGLCEPQEGTSAAGVESELFQEAAVQGQTIFAASGDHGVKDCTGTKSTGASVDDPASQPYVTGVGGTSLAAVGPPPSESVWDSTWSTGSGTASGASGGGVSVMWGMPSYQSGIALPQSSVSCTGSGTSCREVPDVSADADILTGYSIYYSRHWSVFGGTSAAAPTWAALATLANASVACAGKTVGFANPVLYQAARNGSATYFNDVTSGNNSYGGLTGFSAAAGYDMASGLGSPKGAAVAAAMCGSTWTPPAPPAATTPPAPGPAPVVTLTRPAAHKARVGRVVHLQLHATDSAGQALTYHATGLPAGLSLAAATGLISGSPTRAGKFATTVTVTDASGSTAQAALTWNIAGRPTVTGGLTVNSKGRPSLSLRVGAGANAPPIQSIVVAPSRQVRFARRARDLARGVTVRNSSGHRLKSAARLRGNDLVVTLRSPAVRKASLRVTVPAIRLIKTRSKLGTHRGSAVLQSVTVTVIDAFSFRTAFLVR